MQFQVFDNNEEMSRAAASFIANTVQKKKPFIFCPAAGNTPRLTYRYLRDAYSSSSLFKDTKITMLDEWLGIPKGHAATCLYQIQQELILPLNLKIESIFESSLTSEEALMSHTEPKEIDLCLLGLGLNGHIGLNEPSKTLKPHCHITALSKESLKHAMLRDLSPAPTHGITLGMSDILQSQEILLLVNSPAKRNAFEKFRQAQIDCYFPASFLWLHPHAHCFYVKDVLK